MPIDRMLPPVIVCWRLRSGRRLAHEDSPSSATPGKVGYPAILFRHDARIALAPTIHCEYLGVVKVRFREQQEASVRRPDRMIDEAETR